MDKVTIEVDLYSKVVLTVIALSLVAIVARSAGPAAPFVPVAYASGIEKLNYAKDGGVGVACSADGKYVFVSGNEGVMRSEDYGRVGTWSKTIKED